MSIHIGDAEQDILARKNNYTSPIKINSSGKFLRFPGVTVISSVGDKYREIWKNLYEELSKSQLIQKYYSLLPSESYHLTTINLYTEKNDGGIQWSLFIEKELPWFQQLNEELRIREFQPRINIIKAIVGRSALLLLVELDSDQVKKNLALAQTFSLEKKIPEEFHITFGYPHKDIPNDDKKRIGEETQKIVEKILGSGNIPKVFQKLEFQQSRRPVFESDCKPALTERLSVDRCEGGGFKDWDAREDENQLLKDFRNTSFTFKEPELCYFTDMTKFIPWNGQMNPFN